MSYQSLYRRYRPRRFAEIRGQDHIVTALRNSVREGRVGHAYLFSGPRGTGKTSTARILAKVLNCAAPVDGEPCLQCESCIAIEAGTSFDVHELDAASNNKVDDIRELIERVAFATPGRTKLYILDEVHMLSNAASAALLKTLEEPPPGVVFVLATTDPQKVIETIRSRTQHFEFHLLPAAPLEQYLRYVIDDAELDVPADAIDFAVRAGRGSARDAVSALEQVVAAGGIAEREVSVDDIIEGLADRDAGRVLVAVADGVNSGRDPRLLAQQLVTRLRDVFLGAMKAPLDHLSDADRARVEVLIERFERPMITRSIEVLGEALAAMVEAVDQRIVLEAALVRLANVEADTSPAALLERIERLEAALAAGGARKPPSGAPGSAPPGARPADAARQLLRERRGDAPTADEPTPPAHEPAPTADEPTSPAPPVSAAVADLPSRDELTLAWGDTLLAKVPRAAKPRYAGGRFVTVDERGAVFALPNAAHRSRCEEHRAGVEQVLSDHFGRPVPLVLVIDDGASAAVPATSAAAIDEPVEEIVDVHELEDAPPDKRSDVDRIAAAFPGAELVEEGDDD
ncbi:MAG TPA: DNA polymerase III subunit gamma/tau [Acidimicrobiales bacterium]|nr:DNA polymerase III subunit gamma/tau [Acidimicrobiales bacterium]